jgi:general secretion pathway protein H
MSSKRHKSGGEQATGDAGFSLLELLVVLAVMAGVAALWLPRFGSGPPRTAVQSMAVQLAADLRATRAEALRSNTEQSFTLDLAKRVSWSQTRPAPRSFADGVDVEVTGPDLKWMSERTVQLRFQPGGAATGSEITVRDRRADARNAVRVHVDWLTGVARIERAR